MDPGAPPASDPADEAVRLVHQVRDLMLACRTVAERLALPPAPGEPSGVAGERIAYGVLVAPLQEDLNGRISMNLNETVRRLTGEQGPLRSLVVAALEACLSKRAASRP
jgi:hypothetical protein